MCVVTLVKKHYAIAKLVFDRNVVFDNARYISDVAFNYNGYDVILVDDVYYKIIKPFYSSWNNVASEMKFVGVPYEIDELLPIDLHYDEE